MIKSDQLSVQGAKVITGFGAPLQSAASQNTPGSYSQIVAATVGPVRFLSLYMYGVSGTQSVLIEIGVGAGGSEVVCVSFDAPNNNAVGSINMPINPGLIPAGSRAAIRITNRSNNDIVTLNVGCYLGETA